MYQLIHFLTLGIIKHAEAKLQKLALILFYPLYHEKFPLWTSITIVVNMFKKKKI